ncbi:protein of unknown function DUF1624 [Desulfofarcimen acetoxidans DSM 771]|uniref:Heparan-alpha-glucosaminide N-acetyltransferase catalytic domain-containing protein n=1 Tax=Desulfofarcimen acetoxidans (strain ATCC 49208 / DSM 771 / KCTC 5769 / VKM B-1644 / 5575) TaxID=485916 RepID=C8VYY9_DESAS|nr:heparan-alpha-glucosaminide N-acetyltransferase [Desulfofarcimen acetoxidans]ACV62899.1 protein of unknown function DUF1624 [Desulfofarcimen acetoxidans DSM 771]
MSLNNSYNRIWEIDFIRGIAIILMIIFHLLYDLAVFYNFPINIQTGIIYYTGKIAASLFIVVAGVSCSFSKNNLKRGTLLISLGMLIYLLTAVFVPGSNIIFGILQFLGLSMLLSPLVNRLDPCPLFVIGSIIIISKVYISDLTIGNSWFCPVGLPGPQFSSIDYYPLIPWFGPFLYGIAINKLFYREKHSLFKFSPPQKNLFCFLGQHSLLIYLVHQPVLLLILFLIYTLGKPV